MKAVFITCFVFVAVTFHCSDSESLDEQEAVAQDVIQADEPKRKPNPKPQLQIIEETDECEDHHNNHHAQKLPAFVSVAVTEHNKYRKRHGSPPVTGNEKLQRYAQNYANKLAKDPNNVKHSGGPYGENIYQAWGGSKDKNTIMAKAVKDWYSEVKNYDYNNPGFGMNTGHFTQVVWKASTEIGMGIAFFKDPKYKFGVIVVGSYKPPGNYPGQFQKNVLPPK